MTITIMVITAALLFTQIICYAFRSPVQPFQSNVISLSARDRSDYDSSPAFVKLLVNGLTEIFKVFASEDTDEVENRSAILSAPADPELLLQSIASDFNRGYLFTGDINFSIYDEDCKFTDPTISFRGLSTFKRNINAIRPLLDNFLLDREVILYSCEFSNDNSNKIVATWKMSGGVKLFWNPRIDLTGETTFSFDRKKETGSCFIVDYFERWDIAPSAALLQLLTPGPSIRQNE